MCVRTKTEVGQQKDLSSQRLRRNARFSSAGMKEASLEAASSSPDWGESEELSHILLCPGLTGVS